MKKAIFVCLLSLTLCLSKAAELQANPATHVETSSEKPGTAVHDKAQTNSVNKVDNTPKPGDHAPPANETTKETQVPENKPIPNESKNTSTTLPTPKDDGSKGQTENEVTKGKNGTVTISPAPSSKDKMPPTPSTQQPPTKNNTSANHVEPEPNKSTETPPKQEDKIVQARGFDGASFIGGIILTLGLLAIGFMGYKYYKNQTERNYHTL